MSIFYFDVYLLYFTQLVTFNLHILVMSLYCYHSQTLLIISIILVHTDQVETMNVFPLNIKKVNRPSKFTKQDVAQTDAAVLRTTKEISLRALSCFHPW